MQQAPPKHIGLHYLPVPVTDRIFGLLSDTDLTTLHLTSRSILEVCYKYLRNGREKSRIQREKYFDENYATKLNVSSPLIKHQLHQAYSDLVRREHVRKYPRFYILCIDIERLTTSKFSLLIKTYKGVFCYLFQSRSKQFPEELQIDKNDFMSVFGDILGV